ncbi:MAG: peptidase, partial [Phenylobacterium zucineum]
MRKGLMSAACGLALACSGWQAAEAADVPAPRVVFGFDIGDDYHLANYTQLQAYWKLLASKSDRMKLTTIGKTAEGRDQLMAIVSTPENLKNLERYQGISRRLAKAEGLTDEEAKALAAEGKAVVWIDGGLHSTETVGAQQLTQTLYEMVSKDDPETLRFLKDAIILFTPANPDGMELVSNWYMREKDPAKREFNHIPRLYQKYVGHDNNRDFFMSNQAENININKVLYRDWFPQIVYNHHQTGPEGMIVFIPPFRDPYNYNLDPLVITGLDGVGASMTERLIREGKPGSGRRSVATYSNWTNATLRSTALFHNSIGILTEISGHPTPMPIPLVPKNQIARNDLPLPLTPQATWKFKQSIDYSVSMNRAVLDYAVRNRENLLFQFYKMGKNGIDKGAQDSWTITPKKVAALEAAAKAGPKYEGAPQFGRRSDAVDPTLFDKYLRDPAQRDPRGYVIPADQTDLPTAVAFVNMLVKSGVDVGRATQPFTVGGKSYPAGSFVVKTGQAYRATVLDMFEPQDHPNDFAYPGGPPIPPYDVAGYTPIYQMGVKFDRVLDGFDAPVQPL